MASRLYVVAPDTVTDPTDETVTIPKYTDSEWVDGFSSAQVPAPAAQALLDTLGVAEDDPIYLVRMEATSSEFEAFEANVSDIFRVTTMEADVPTISPQQAADYLNKEFRPQSWEEYKASQEDLRDLTASEWAEQLGVDGGL